MENERLNRRFRLRISILNLLLITTIVAMGLVIWQQHQAESELRNIIRSAALLEVEDRSQYYATQIPTGGFNHWTWRVYLPPGAKYRLVAGFGSQEDGKSGFVGPAVTVAQNERVEFVGLFDGSEGIPAGEHVVAFALLPRDTRQSHSKYDFDVHLSCDGSGWSDGIGVSRGWSIEKARNVEIHVMSDSTSRPPLELLKGRLNDKNTPPLTDEFWLWIEPIEE